MTTDGFPSTKELLERVAEESDAAADLVEGAEIKKEFEGTVRLTVTTQLTASESISTKTFSGSEYRSKRQSSVPYESRYAHAPSDFDDKTVSFIESVPVSTCTKCDGKKKHDCPTCNGTGTERCETCNGSKTVDCSACGGEGNESCSTCGGSATVTVGEESQCTQCEGSMKIDCPDCGGADDDCPTCDGDGRVSCPRCDGDGIETTTHKEPCPDCVDGTEDCSACGGTGEESCSDCGGTGTQTCSNCNGNKQVTCRRCGGDGETAKARYGSVTFERQQSLSTDNPDVPTGMFRGSDGTLVDETRTDSETEASDSPSTYRKRVEKRDVPAKSVLYRFRGKRFVVTNIDDEVRFDDYPRSEDHYRDQIKKARNNGKFDYGRPRSVTVTVGDLLKDASVLAGGVVAGIVATFVAAIVVLVLSALLPLGSATEDILGLGGGAVLLLFVALAIDRYDSPDSDAFYPETFRGHRLLLPGIALVAAVGAVVASGLNEQTQVMVLAAASAFWGGRVGLRVTVEGERVDYALRKREAFLQDLSGDRGELAELGLSELLPDSSPAPNGDELRRVGRAVYVLCWGVSVYLLGVLVSGSLLGVSLLEYTGFTLAVGIPVAAIVLATVALGLIGVRKVLTDL
ncbi:hypothetical protein [Halobaculum sp. D14]|uniref:hypothetical protein n=1 Tax=Halobaculum sp. D14 TaxID=3421642 RepID=UPI003EBD81E1